MRVRHAVRTVNREILHVEQHKGRDPGCLLRLDMLKVRRLHAIQYECRPPVFLQESDFHVVQFDSLGMADEEAISRQHAEHRGLGILLFPLRRGVGFARRHPARGPEEESIHQIRRLPGHLIQCQTAPVQDADIAQLHVLDVVPRNAAENRTVPWIGVVHHDVRDVHPADRPDRGAFRRPHPAAQPQEDRGIGNFPPGDVRNRDVFDVRAIHALERETARAVEDYVRDRNVPEIAFRFRTDLDAPGGAVAVGGLFDGPLITAVHQGADVVAAHQTIGDGDVLRRARESQRVRALQDDGVIVGRIDAAIGNPHIAARVQVDAIPVGVDGQIVDREIVHAGRQDSEVPAGQNRKIAQRHLAAEFQGDRFVAAATSPARQGLPADQAAADDRHVLQSFTPDQTVVEMAVSEILKLVPLVGLGRIVGGRVGRCFQRATRFELQGEIAAQANRPGHVGSRREIHRPAARRRRGIDRLIDGAPVGSLAIALRPERLHVEDASAELLRKQPRRQREYRPACCPTSGHAISFGPAQTQDTSAHSMDPGDLDGGGRRAPPGYNVESMRTNPPKPVALNDLLRQTTALHSELAAAVNRVLASGWYILGRECAAFESEFAAYCGVAHCVSVANGTDALELALRSLGIGPGDSVATVANAGGYSTTAIRAVGAEPLYIDIDPGTMNMSVADLAARLTPAVRAVIATHLYGRMALLPARLAVTGRAAVPRVEDGAQSHGAAIGGKKAGSWGALACFSFYPTKNLGALGDGGAITTHDEQLAQRRRSFRPHGWASNE